MLAAQTEALHDHAHQLDARPLTEVAHVLADAQAQAASVVRSASVAIAAAAETMATAVSSGGVLHYAAAGSSGLMAAADAQELGGTFSISPAQIRIHMAGGLPTGVQMPGDTEDHAAGLQAGLEGMSGRDVLIAVSASGTTPYTLEAAHIARQRGARIVAIANNRRCALLDAADHAICLPTSPEVLSGSTRMGAGTAQKIALNMLSTLMAVRLGHVYDGMMVNLRADNAKLRSRAAGMVSRIADVDDATARAALDAAQGVVKTAVLIAQGHAPGVASDVLKRNNGNLRAALAALAE